MFQHSYTEGFPRRASFLIFSGLSVMGFISSIFFFPKDYIPEPEVETRVMDVEIHDPKSFEKKNTTLGITIIHIIIFFSLRHYHLFLLITSLSFFSSHYVIIIVFFSLRHYHLFFSLRHYHCFLLITLLSFFSSHYVIIIFFFSLRHYHCFSHPAIHPLRFRHHIYNANRIKSCEKSLALIN